MDIRRARAEDARAIADVHVLGWQVGYRGLLPQAVLDALCPDHRVPRWTKTLEQAAWPRQGTLLAEEAGEPVGFADLRPTWDADQDPTTVAEVASFYVLPSAWGRGIGRALMAATLGTMSKAGYVAATLWVLEGNTGAIRFYARMGWEPDGAARDDVVGDLHIRDLRLRRALGAS